MDDSTPSLGVGFAIGTGSSYDALLRLQKLMDTTQGRIATQAAKIEKATSGMVDTRAAVASITSFGGALTREAGTAARELSRIEKAGEAMSRQLDRQASTFGKTREEIRQMKVETAALAAEQKGLGELAARLRAQEAALAGQELASARKARFEAEAAAEDRVLEAENAVKAAALQSRAMQNAAAAHASFEAAAKRGSMAMRERQAAENADQAALERLRASTDPLYGATKRLNDEIAESNRLFAAGVTGKAEYERQQKVLTDRTAQLGTATGKSNFALKQTAMQLPDVVQGLLTGQKPMQVFIQQGGQIAQIAQMAEGGVKGFALSLGGVAVAFAPVIAILGTAVGGFALFQRSISAGVDTKAMIAGLGLTRAEIKRLKDTSVSTGDIITATFQVMAKRVGLNLNSMSKWFTDALDWMTTKGRQYLAMLYAQFSGTFQAIAVIVKDVFAGKSVGDIMTDVGKAYKGSFKEADDALIKLGSDITKQVGANKLADLRKQAAEIKADRTPKKDTRAETLTREAEAVEAQIRNTYALAQAYKYSGGAALIAEARTKAESEAIKKRGDIGAFVDRQIRLSIAERVKDGSKAESTLDEQARVIEQVNSMVSAGLVPAQRANQLIQERTALLPVLAAAEAAATTKNTEALLAAERVQRDLIAAQKRLDDAQKQTSFNSLMSSGRDQLEMLREEARLVGATAAVRERAIGLLRIEQQARAEGWDNGKLQSALDMQTKISDATDRLADRQSAWNEQMERFADIAARADDTARSLSNAFGNVGSSIGDAISILGRYGAEQARIDELVRNRQKSEAWGAKQSADLQLNSMIALTGTAKGLFAEHSKGYKAMLAAEQALTVVQLARTAVDVAGGAARMFASLGPLGFPAVAAMVGVMASLGFSGGGASNYKAPTNSGTGTVLGDSSAKSDSLKRAIDALREVDTLTSVYARQMAASLKSIESQIGGAASILVRGGALDASANIQTGFQTNLIGKLLGGGSSALALGAIGSAIGGPIGFIAGSAIGALTNVVKKIPIIGDIVGAIGGVFKSLFGSRIDVTGSGVVGNRNTLGNILQSGLDLDTYSDVTKTKKFFGVVSGRSSWTQYQDQGQAFGSQFTLILKSFNDAIRAAAGPLGVATSDVEKKLSAFVVDIGKVQLSGLSGTEIQEKLTAVFSAVGDNLASAAFPTISKFQKVGEGAFETLVRVATSLEAVTASLDLLGRSAVGLSVDAKMAIVDQFESASAYSSAIDSFFGTYYTKAEQAAARTAQFGKVFDSLGLTMPGTMAAFRAMVEAQDLATAAGRDAYAALIQLAPAFADLQTSLLGVKSASDILSERQDLERQLLELQGNTAAIRALDLAQLDASNRALQQQIYALQDAQEAAKAAQELRDAWKSVGDSILDEVKRIRGVTGGSGTFAQLMSQFNTATSAARLGDMDAAKSLVGLSQSLLTAAAQVATSGQELNRVQAQTAASLEATYASIAALAGTATPTSAQDMLTAAAVAAAAAATQAPANDDLISALREELSSVRTALEAIKLDTGQQVRILGRVEEGGAVKVATTDDRPLRTEAA